MRALPAIVLVAGLAAPSVAAAQATTDTELWTSAGVAIELPERFDVSWENSLRFDDDVGRVESLFHELAARYRANDYLRLQLGYRYYHVRDGDTAHRVFGDADLRFEPRERWKVGYRARLQTTTRPAPDENLTYLRNRIEATYEVRKDVDVSAGFELYYRFRVDGNEFRRYRIPLGVDWKLRPRVELSFFYMLQQEFNVNDPERDHVFGVALGYEIDVR